MPVPRMPAFHPSTRKTGACWGPRAEDPGARLKANSLPARAGSGELNFVGEVQLRRVFDEDAVTCGLLGSPLSKQVE